MSKEAQPKQIIIYANQGGYEPFTEWIDNLLDKQGKRRILQRLRRLEQGNYGDVAPIGDGLSELRMFFGSGYRVYFGEDQENIVIVLCGGDKDTQQKDIDSAKAYWKEYLSREKI
ncbi:type II toxin-antitoxin system RelE/ParE family toxin [Anabaena minutissima FACHB-250]|uniref:type II toxin-antitoxin system RelE/ParE family toxin n=1 Tax=Anabaena sp. CCY 9402-a TaxID=3103867 RepID=UPI001685DEB2|nr:type II toxin-antitoxin system RelE/ParE family toxin [Anabaena minutissima FACHB-250]